MNENVGVERRTLPAVVESVACVATFTSRA